MPAPSTASAVALLLALHTAATVPAPLQIRLRLLPDCRALPDAAGCPMPAPALAPPQVQALNPAAAEERDHPPRRTATW